MKLRKIIPGWSLLEYLLLRLVSALVNLLSMPVATSFARGLGCVLYFFMPGRAKTAFENLEIAYRETLPASGKKKIARESFLNLITSIMESFRIPHMLREARDRFEFEGTEYLDQAFAKGKGIIFTISHLGSWEYLAFLPYLRGYPCSVIVRDIRNPYVDKWVTGLRRQTKLNPINRSGSIRQVMKELKQNHLVAILIDQWAGQDGLWIDFFTQPTSTTSIPARIAKRTGAALIAGYCLRTRPGHYKIVIKPELPYEDTKGDDETRMSLKLNKLLEKEILTYPEQWVWTHRRWKPYGKYRKTPADQNT